MSSTEVEANRGEITDEKSTNAVENWGGKANSDEMKIRKSLFTQKISFLLSRRLKSWRERGAEEKNFNLTHKKNIQWEEKLLQTDSNNKKGRKGVDL